MFQLVFGPVILNIRSIFVLQGILLYELHRGRDENTVEREHVRSMKKADKTSMEVYNSALQERHTQSEGSFTNLIHEISQYLEF